MTLNSLPQRPYLVIVRAGDKSLHPQWLQGITAAERTWDLIVNYYGDDPAAFQDPEHVRIDSKGLKGPALSELLGRPEIDALLSRYRRIWLPDDDVSCSGPDVNRLFEIADQEGFNLAQPSLNPQGYVAHLILFHNPQFRVRRTSFVEVMVPCFDPDTLRLVRPTLDMNTTSWGVDSIVWPPLLEGRRVGVIDAVQVTHTRPVGVSHYAAQTGVQEYAALQQQYGVARGCYRIWEAESATSGRVIRNRFAIMALFTLGLLRIFRKIEHATLWDLCRDYQLFLRQHIFDAKPHGLPPVAAEIPGTLR